MDWYLLIPWALGIGAWLIARQRRMIHPAWIGAAVFFLLGFPIVLLFDFGILG
jgi:hypothetical protein